jgi:hypothetical protein
MIDFSFEKTQKLYVQPNKISVLKTNNLVQNLEIFLLLFNGLPCTVL